MEKRMPPKKDKGIAENLAELWDYLRLDPSQRYDVQQRESQESSAEGYSPLETNLS